MPKLLLALLVLAAVMPVSAQHQGHEHHAMPADAPMHEGHDHHQHQATTQRTKVIKGTVITEAITTPLDRPAPPMTCVG